MRLGICVANLEDVKKAKALGYDGYEFSGAALARMSEEEFAELKKVTEELQFPLFGVNSYSSGDPSFVGASYDAQKAGTYAELVCRRVYELGGCNIGIGAPKARKLKEGYDRALADAQMDEFLRITCEAAAGYGETVLLEQLTKGVCNYINTTAEAVAFLEKLQIPNLKLVLDFYHCIPEEQDWEDRFRTLLPIIAHVHISTTEKDGNRRCPTAANPDGHDRIFALIRDCGYDGTISIEPRAFDEAEAKASIAYIKTLTT